MSKLETISQSLYQNPDVTVTYEYDLRFFRKDAMDEKYASFIKKHGYHVVEFGVAPKEGLFGVELHAFAKRLIPTLKPNGISPHDHAVFLHFDERFRDVWYDILGLKRNVHIVLFSDENLAGRLKMQEDNIQELTGARSKIDAYGMRQISLVYGLMYPYPLTKPNKI